MANSKRAINTLAVALTSLLALGSFPFAAHAAAAPVKALAAIHVDFINRSSQINQAAAGRLAVEAGSFETASAITITGYVRGLKQSAAAKTKGLARAQAVAQRLSQAGIAATMTINGVGVSDTYGNSLGADRVDVLATATGNLLWSEEFNSPTVKTFNHSNWTALLDHGYEQLGFWNYGTGEIESNTEAAANEDGKGNLALTATNTNGTWTSARLWTQGKVNFQYGELRIRAKMPVGAFNWPAIWSLGSNYSAPNHLFGSVDWPASGEADIAEGLGGNSVVQGTIHGLDPATGGPWFGGGGFTAVAPVNDFTSKFHVYGIQWKPNEFDFTVDGKVYSKNVYDGTRVTQTFANGQTRSLVVGSNWPYNQGIFLILDNAIQAGTSAPNGSNGTMLVDWIRYTPWQGYGSVK